MPRLLCCSFSRAQDVELGQALLLTFQRFWRCPRVAFGARIRSLGDCAPSVGDYGVVISEKLYFRAFDNFFKNGGPAGVPARVQEGGSAIMLIQFS